MPIMPQAGRQRTRGSIPGKGKRFSSLRNVQTRSVPNSATLSVGTGDTFSRNGRGVKLTSGIHLVRRLRMSGDTPSLPPVTL